MVRMVRMVRSLADRTFQLRNERAMHDRYLQLFKEVDEDGNGAMDFAEFLLLMRKLVDIDFGGIATRMQADSKTDDKKKVKKK